ncbi:MAG TPA: ATP-binding protein [Longimicrobiaceae bacterium]|nr:ATP-binding protein [Longimicrobiaceae bacterium]
MASEKEGTHPPSGSPAEESRLRAIINHVADGIVIIDDEGLIRFANPAAESLLGREAADLLGQPFGLPAVQDQTVEIDVLGRNAAPILGELRVTRMEWEGVPGYLVSIRDITDRQQAEERARQLAVEQAARTRAEEEERRARFLAEAGRVLDSSLAVDRLLVSLARLMITPEEKLDGRTPGPGGFPRLADLSIIDVVERDGSVRRVAVAHHDPRKHGLAMELKERFPPHSEQPYLSASVLRTGEPILHRHLTDEVIADNTRDARHADLVRQLGIVSVIGVPLRTRSEILGALILGCENEPYDESDLAFAIEFAKRAALSITNARLFEEAQAASRAKSDFLAVMSHELRTPLNAILGYTDLLRAEIAGPLDRKQLEYLDRVNGSSRHLLQIVEEVLTYARTEADREQVRIQPIETAAFLGEIVAMIEPQAQRKELDFVVSIDPPPTPIRSDPAKLRQILVNLLSNAVNFTKEGEIRLEVEPGGDEHLLIRVGDSGIGVAEANLDRIFEPFWQVEQSARRVVGGTGLGLSVARRLADLLGGRITVASKEGEGSVFTVELPIRPPFGDVDDSSNQPAFGDEGGDASRPAEAEPDLGERLQAADRDAASGGAVNRKQAHDGERA